jgi:hypothetical protein
LDAGLTIQPCKKVIVTKPPKRGDQGPNCAVEPYDDDDDDDDDDDCEQYIFSACEYFGSI